MHDCIRKPESVSILFCSHWRSYQSFNVSFELEWFQFFPLTIELRVHQTERFFQGMEGKWLQVILSLFLPPPPLLFLFAVLVCFTLLFWVSLVLCIALFNLLLFFFFFFSVLVYFVFHIKIKIKIEKYKNCVYLCTLVLVYLGWPLKQSFLNFVSFVA